MDFIKQNIGPNKVSLTLRDSPYYERSNIGEKLSNVDKNKVDKIIDLVDMLKDMKPIRERSFKEMNKDSMNTIKTLDKNTSLNKNNSLDKYKNTFEPKVNVPMDNLCFVLMKIIDPMMDLYTDKLDRISKFKKNLLDNLTNYNNMYKKLDLKKFFTLDELDTSIKDSKATLMQRTPLLYYISRLANTSIVFYTQSEPILIECGQKCRIINLDEMKIGYSLEEDEKDLYDIKRSIMDDRIKKYIKDGLLNNITTLGVKELRDISEKLDVSIYKIEDNKKKLYLKQELKENILKKIETHIA